ncbi:DNA internalization-related competence protein ComEC/Rec2, partial [Ramlibacter sp. AN1015]|uniref:DNA internalization-related competence protein ComEC/Rec2 n=1 Tax=Ramlibacter sp. AN1015 TaxID=3133428 RepID=UPI0030C39966
MSAALLGWLAGTALQLQQQALWPAWAYGACAAAALTLVVGALRWRCGGRAAVFAVLLALAAAFAALALTGLRAVHYARSALPVALEARELELAGVVAAMPQRQAYAQRFLFEVESAQLAGASVPWASPVVLSWFAYPGLQPPPALRVGERWRLRVRLKPPHGQVNPGGFDYELALWEQGVRATGYVRAGQGDAAPARLGDSARFPVERLRQQVRDAIFERVQDEARAGVVAALVVGDQRAISRDDWDVFRATGVAHLMSISGLHVTLFAWAAAAVLRRTWRRSARLCLAVPAAHAAIAGGLLLAAAYAVFSGWGVPAQRTVWMLATITALRLAGLQWPWPMVWLLVAAVVLAVDPWALLQPGFWLSFVAVGVLFATRRPALGKLTGLLREQAVITVALAPLTLFLFGQVSLVGLLANLVAVPWVTLVVTPLGLAGVLLPPLWDAAGLAVALLGGVLRPMAQAPAAVWTAAVPPLALAVPALLGSVLLVVRVPWTLRALGVPLLLPALLWQPQRPAPGSFELLAADVGQGSAVLVRTARHSLLYDTGPRWGPDSEAGSRVLVPLLRAAGERLDAVVVSHRDSDHSGGAAAVLATQPSARLWSSVPSGDPVFAGRSSERCVAGRRWTWDGVGFEFLHPSDADFSAPRLRPNALSCVLRVSAAGRVALLAGDIERAQEQRLLAAERVVKQATVDVRSEQAQARAEQGGPQPQEQPHHQAHASTLTPARIRTGEDGGANAHASLRADLLL